MSYVGIGTAPMLTFSTRRFRLLKPSRADLINAESALGSTLFGPIPEGHRREFFHDHGNVWFWFEEWTDEQGEIRSLTVRYEVRENGVFKKLQAGEYKKLSPEELGHFYEAAHLYLKLIKEQIYTPKR